jgi:uncharacterized coiled-coil protein SlyX
MDVEKTMQFILETQARLEASAAGHEERIAKLENSMTTVTNYLGELAQAEVRLSQRMDGMAERMEAGFQELRQLHADTEYKLNSLIDTVDKLVRRNGHEK